MRLHDYQLTAVAHLQGVDRGGLFLDMGLGKTASTLSALTPDHLPALVVAPKRVAENVWPTETRKWRPDLRCLVAEGTARKRNEVLSTKRVDIISISRDNLKDLTPELAKRFRTVILDESSSFKNYRSNRWKLANPLTDPARTPYVWELTGTPTPNGLLDLWAPTYLVDRGARLGRNITAYRNRFFLPGRQLPNGVITEWNEREGAASKIHTLVEDLFLSMSSDDRIDLPPTLFNEVLVTLPPGARATYRKLKNTLVVDVKEVLGVGTLHTADTPAVLSARLSQIAAGCLYPDEAGAGPVDEIHREKLKAVEEIVEGTGGAGGVLVFYRFRWERDRLLEMPGAESIDEPGVLDRWDLGKVRILVAHPASAGHGLNLQYGGHTIVWTSLPWSLEEWQQGNKRLARQGQNQPVMIHYLVAEKTVDSVIRDVLIEKASVQEALMNHLESPL